jgi:exodeoxyribonuclease VII large subunit
MQSKIKDKIEKNEYTISELNKLLNNKFSDAISKFSMIKLKGEIIDCKIFKNNSGISFNICNQNEKFKCKLWASSGINPTTVINYENTNCIVLGKITTTYSMYGHEFYLDIDEITKEDDDSKIKKLKELCETKGYFNKESKKLISWNTIKKIGIISKKDTQGYNDFVKQFNIPLEIILEEIALEGNNTENLLINAINNFKDKNIDVDAIIIIRGGGSTSDISISFDKINIYDAIKKSKIPIITAIGHEADKDDKLLITNISDLDYPTPSTAALNMNKIFMTPLFDKLKNIIEEIENKFNDMIEIDRNDEYKKLDKLLVQFFNDKFNGQIVNISENEKHIIVQLGNNFYKVKIDLTDKIDINKKEILSMNNIYFALDNEDINTVFKEFKHFDTINNVLVQNINNSIKNIKAIDKLEDKFNNSIPTKIKTLYCKKYNLNDCEINKIQQIYNNTLWYKKILEENDNKDEIKEVYNYLYHDIL